MMQNGQLHIFDIIMAVNGQEIIVGGKSPQEALDDLLCPISAVNLTIHRLSYALKTTPKILSVGEPLFWI